MATGFLCEIKRQDIGLTAYAVHVPGKFSDHGYPIQPKQVLLGSSLFGPSHDNFRSQVGFARELLSAELIEGTENAFGKRLSPYLRGIAGGITGTAGRTQCHAVC